MAHILLIEPNTVLARSYRQALEHAGHEVKHVLSAQTAIDAADTRMPDVVILELQLPKHNGVEFLHEFRSYAEWQRVPVVVNTLLPPASIGEGRRVLTQELGVREVLYKPKASLQELMDAVRDHAIVS